MPTWNKHSDILVSVSVRPHNHKGVDYGTYVNVSSKSPLGLRAPDKATDDNFIATYTNEEDELLHVITLSVPPFVQTLIDIQRYFPEIKKVGGSVYPLQWRSKVSLYPTKGLGNSLKIYVPKAVSLAFKGSGDTRLARVNAFQKLRESFLYLDLPAPE